MDLTDVRVAAALDAIDALDPNLAGLVRRRWHEHERHEAPLLAIFGPQNAGKSNILKRLLIDDGMPVPTWLRGGARPEDTTGEIIEWGGWRVLDLPGIGSEQTRHDDTAWDALELADAVLLVMSLKLLTGEGLKALEVVDGSWWTVAGETLSWPDGGLHLAIARVDSGAADPEDDPDELDDLTAELAPAVDQLLAPVGGLKERTLHWTAASPSGILDRGPDVERHELDRFREWDGMHQLEEALRSAATSATALRDAALLRFLHRAAKEARRATDRELEGLRRQLQEAELISRHRKLVDEAVAGTVASTEVKLSAVVLDCFTSALDDIALGVSASLAMEQKFHARAETFETTYVADVDALIEELRRLIEDLPELTVADPHESRGPRRSGHPRPGPTFNVKAATDSVRGLTKQGVELRLRASISEVTSNLDSLKRLKGDALADALEKAGFSSAHEADAAKRLITRFDQASKVIEAAPQAEQLFRLLNDFRRGKLEQTRARKAAEQQDELVAGLVRELMDHEPDGYRTRLERLRQAAVDAFAGADDAEPALKTAERDLLARLAALDAAVAQLHT